MWDSFDRGGGRGFARPPPSAVFWTPHPRPVTASHGGGSSRASGWGRRGPEGIRRTANPTMNNREQDSLLRDLFVFCSYCVSAPSKTHGTQTAWDGQTQGIGTAGRCAQKCGGMSVFAKAPRAVPLITFHVKCGSRKHALGTLGKENE